MYCCLLLNHRYVCTDLFSFFLSTPQDRSYFLLGSSQISENQLFTMYHSNTPAHNIEVLQESLQSASGTVRIVFVTNALSMGVNMAGVNNIIHYGSRKVVRGFFPGKWSSRSHWWASLFYHLLVSIWLPLAKGTCYCTWVWIECHETLCREQCGIKGSCCYNTLMLFWLI